MVVYMMMKGSHPYHLAGLCLVLKLTHINTIDQKWLDVPLGRDSAPKSLCEWYFVAFPQAARFVYQRSRHRTVFTSEAVLATVLLLLMSVFGNCQT